MKTELIIILISLSKTRTKDKNNTKAWLKQEIRNWEKKMKQRRWGLRTLRNISCKKRLMKRLIIKNITNRKSKKNKISKRWSKNKCKSNNKRPKEESCMRWMPEKTKNAFKLWSLFALTRFLKNKLWKNKAFLILMPVKANISHKFEFRKKLTNYNN